MKRAVSWLEVEEEPVKKRRVDGSTGHLPKQNNNTSILQLDANFAVLPTEICRHITTIKNHGDSVLRDQKSLALSSKKLKDLILQIWHEDSSRLWPRFYTSVMKHMDWMKFFATFIKLRTFSFSLLEVAEEREEFMDVDCPLCDHCLESKGGKFGEIMTCNKCVKHHGKDWRIEWQLEYEEFTCEGCHINTPFKRFECDNCNKSFCYACKKMRFRWPVYGDEDSTYCVNCATDCEHCADWGATEGNTCSRCGEPRCSRCEDAGHCENETVDSDEEDYSSEDSSSDHDESAVDKKSTN